MLAFPEIRTLKAAVAVAGTLGHPSKMPGTSYGIPAAACKVGAKLRNVAGSTCSHCYAYEKNNYAYSSVKIAQARRLDGINHPQWVEAMTFMLLRANAAYHRWHDSGDIQSLTHLGKIIAVCEMTPAVQHWLPTREFGMVSAYVKMGGTIPANLTIRVSASMIDGAATAHWPHTSTVHDKSAAHGQSCPAPTQGNKCQDCRACWSKEVANVSYHVH